MSAKRLPRPQIQRAFVSWLNERQSCFRVGIRISKITAKGVELVFKGYPDCLSVWLTRSELGVHVEWQGVYWDCLIDLDASPFHTLGGYQCGRCEHEEGVSGMIFTSREALWKDHLFEPFLKWVNEKLAPARWLGIFRMSDEGATWAELMREESAMAEPSKFIRELVLLPRSSN